MSDTNETVRKDLEPIFYPKSVAVVGTNSVKGTVPHDIFYNILKDNYQGVLYPVSPGKTSICSVKACKYIVDIEDPVDMAVLVFPSSVCHMAMEQMGEKGVKGAIIISAGFREVGEAGIQREEKIKEIARKYGISFIGPNCLGVINTDPKSHLNASFARNMPTEGSIGFLSQSGALCTAVLDYAQAKNIGFSKFVSFGNKADISEIDLLYYLKDDPKTKVILIYLEEISDGPGLMKAARDIVSSGKPILAIKSGRTSAGAAAAASHTGSLAASDSVTDAAFEQAGIIRCADLEDMFNKAIAMAYQPVPRGRKIAIITNAGGPGVLTTDAAIDKDLELAKFSDATTEVFKKSLPATANIKNPVDVIGDARADRYKAAMDAALKDPGVDGAFVILTPQSMTDIDTIAQEVCRVSDENSGKPLYASFMGEYDVESGVNILQTRNIPHYQWAENMPRAYAAACRFGELASERREAPKAFENADMDKVKAILEKAKSEGRTHLPVDEASGVLDAYGFPMLPSKLAKSPDEAAEAFEEIGGPVVLKISSVDVIHKVDVGGVVLDIESKDEAAKAYEQIIANVKKSHPDANIEGVRVEKMARGGIEIILGLKRDPAFGPTIMFGLGGSFVEIFKDVKLRVAPIRPSEAKDMVESINAWPLLSGARGKAKRDVASIEECIQRLSKLAVELDDIQELDINPLLVMDEGKGCFVADARIML